MGFHLINAVTNSSLDPSRENNTFNMQKYILSWLTTIKQYSIFLNRYFGYQLNDYALEINYQLT